MMWFLLCCLLLFSSGQAANIFPVPPSFGDVAVMEGNGIVVINLAPEAQGQDKEELYYFCSSRPGDPDSISKVLSVQLGYSSQGCDFVPRPLENAWSVSCGNCTGSEAHVLRCCNATLSVCDWVLALSKQCQGSESKRKPYSQDQSAYPGEVLLFPPVSSLSDSSPTSFSMGLVAVKKETSESPTWKSVIKDNATVPMTLVSTLCRQMGYTHVDPGSVTTLGVVRDLFNYNFSFWANTMSGPRLQTSAITCPESECCLQCCKQTQGLATSEEDKNDDDILVIRCLYYLDASEIPSGGNKVKCQVTENGDKLKSSCSNSSGSTSSGFTCSKTTFGLAISLAILVCVLFICNIVLMKKYIQRCIKRLKGGRREGYEELELESCWKWRHDQHGNPQSTNGDPPPDAHT